MLIYTQGLNFSVNRRGSCDIRTFNHVSNSIAEAFISRGNQKIGESLQENSSQIVYQPTNSAKVATADDEESCACWQVRSFQIERVYTASSGNTLTIKSSFPRRYEFVPRFMTIIKGASWLDYFNHFRKYSPWDFIVDYTSHPVQETSWLTASVD